MRAATTLRLAQPALSRQLQSLEQAVGTSLLIREPRGVRLTGAGKSLLSAIGPLFERLEDALCRVYLANDGRLGTLRVGIGREAIDSSQVGRAIMALREQFPAVHVILTEVASGAHSEKLRARELDLAIGVNGAGDASVASVALIAFHADSALLAATHPLATRSSLAADDLRSERFLVVDQSMFGPFRELYEELAGLGVHESETYASVDSVFSLVAAGRGWTVTAASLMAAPPAGTVVIPFDGLRVPMHLAVRWRLNDESPLVGNVTSFLQQLSDDPVAHGHSIAVDDVRAEPPHVPPRLEMRHLQAVVAIAEAGSLSRAAKRLGLTQSGLSRQIRSLEHDIGAPLFRRKSNGVALTEAGEVLREEAQRVLAAVQDALARARHSVKGITGRCTIATIATEFSGNILVEVLKDLSGHHPDIIVNVSEMMTPFQVLALKEHRIDLGVAGANAGLVDEPLIASVRLMEDIIECALLVDSHPLASRAWLKPADLADVPFLFIERSTYPRFYDIVMRAFDDVGLVPRVNGSFNGPRAMWRSAAESLGWTLGSRSMRARPLAGLIAVPIEGLHIPSGIQLLWRRDESDPAVLTVREAFRRLHSPEVVHTNDGAGS